MKELTKDFESGKVEIREEKQQEKQIKLIGQQRKVPGHTLWEFNLETKELNKATFKKTDVAIASLDNKGNHRTEVSYKVEVNERCIYFQSLNRKNAEKTLKRIIFKEKST